MATRRRPTRYTEAQIEAALRKTGAVLNATAQELECNLRTLYRWLDKFPRLKQVREEVDEMINDMAESVIVHHLQQKNLTAAIYRLKTKARHRGWGETVNQEHSGKGGGPIGFSIENIRGLTDEQLDEFAKRVKQQLDGQDPDAGATGAPKPKPGPKPPTKH